MPNIEISTTTSSPTHGGYTDVARALTSAYGHRGDGKPFTRQQVHVWWLRRGINGFPPKHDTMVKPGGREQFSISEAVAWYATYTPTRGGRPRG